MSDWINDYYDDVDHMRLDDWLARHTDDVVVKFGNNPPSRGKEEVGGNIGYFWTLIGGLKHNFVNTGPNPLILYTVYGPPEHAEGAVHKTKDQADAMEEAGKDEPPAS